MGPAGDIAWVAADSYDEHGMHEGLYNSASLRNITEFAERLSKVARINFHCLLQ